MSEPTRVDRLREIDALRIGAAVAVMVYHYTFAHTVFGGVSQVTRFGYLGVDLFFVISGFVSLLTAFGRTPRQFAASRAARLYPAFWIAVTFTTAGSILLSSADHISLVRYLTNLTMFNALADQPNIDVVYWTLWAEMRFYFLILLLTFVKVTRQRVLSALWFWLGITLLLKIGVLPGAAQSLLTLVFQPEWSQYFIAGMAMCVIYKFGVNWQSIAFIVAGYAIAVPTAIAFGHKVAIRYSQPINPVAIAAVVTLVFVVMVLVALRVTRNLARPWFTILGALTYPLYLIHDRFGTLIYDKVAGVVNRWIVVLALIAMMTAVAYGIHVFVERPLAPRVRRLIEGRKRHVPAHAVAAGSRGPTSPVVARGVAQVPPSNRATMPATPTE
jgi:peptidoglycan/LPS O-acetylase OafA/YrhL